MPELPEVETIRAQLEPRLVGRRLELVSILDPRLTRPLDPREVSAEIEGARVEAVERRAVQLDSAYFAAWNTLGAIHIVRREPGPALEALTRATTLEPRNAQAFANLALAHRLAGDERSAAAASSRACTSASSWPLATVSPRFTRQRIPTAWSTSSSFVRRPAPSSSAAIPTAIA